MIKKLGSRALMALLYGAGFSAACSGGGTVNIGNTNAVGSQLSDYAASWDGYAEAYTFTPDGSDHVRLTIGSSGQGTLEVGDQPLLAPPTDPTVGYPPGESSMQAGLGYPNTGLNEGVLFPIYDAQIQTDRIQVGIKPNDLYAAWCALQTPTSTSYKEELLNVDAGPPGAPGAYTRVAVDAGPDLPADSGVTTVYTPCPYDSGGSSSPDGTTWTCYGQDPDGQQVVVDCGRLNLCIQMVCGCTATSCTSSPLVAAGSPPSQYPVELDAALDSTGTTLTGTLALSTDLRVTVVLTKQ
jgi:hypothetical protein